MAFSESLANRIRDAISLQEGVEEKKLFGGIGFLNGNMLVGVWKDSLIVRLGPDGGEQALLESFVRPFDVTGKPMTGWIMVEPDRIENDEQLAGWIERATEFVKTLPKK